MKIKEQKIEAVRWGADGSTGLVLNLVGHGNAVVNSFGQPVIYRDGEYPRVIEQDEWVCKLPNGKILVVGDYALRALTEE